MKQTKNESQEVPDKDAAGSKALLELRHPAMVRACATVMLTEAPAAVTTVRSSASGAPDRLYGAMHAMATDVGVIAIIVEV